jgi:hypothetical protein
MAAASVPPASREGLRAGGRPHRRRLRDDVSTIKTTYRLFRLALMLLITQNAWSIADTTLQVLLA